MPSKKIIITVLFLLIASTIIGGAGFVSYESDPLFLTQLNLLPVAGIWVVFFALTRRVISSLALSLLLCALLFVTSEIKYENLKIPLMTTDFIILKTLSFQGSVLAKYMSVELTLGIAAVLLALLFLLRVEPTIKFLRGKAALIFWVAIATTFLLFPPVDTIKSYYAESARWLPWNPTKNVKKNGLLAVLTNDLFATDFSLPATNTSFINAFTFENPDIFKPREDRTETKPDVFILLLESFFDPAIIKGVDDCTYLPKLCELRENATWGSLEVPTYGGNTNRTEFEILTGVSLDNYPAHVFPYFSLVTKHLDSYPRLFKASGYETSAIHPHRKEFWNRTTVYKLMDIEHFIGIESFQNDKRDGWYISDKSLLPKLEDLFAKTSPQFNITITMENHGPWGKRENMNEAEIQTLEPINDLSENAQRQWLEYVYHLRHSETLVAELADMINARAKPTIVFAFGDHLPALPLVFDEVTFDDGKAPEEQLTPYIVFDNYSNSQNTRADSSADLVMSEVLRRTALPFREYDFVARYFYQQYADGNFTQQDKAQLSAFQVKLFNNEVGN